MSKLTKMFVVGLGSIFLLTGLAYLLEFFGIPFDSWFLLAIGVVFIGLYAWTKSKPILFISYFLLTEGVVKILRTVNLIPGQYSIFAFVLAIAVSLLLIYMSVKSRGLLYISFAIILADAYLLLSAMSLNHSQFVGFFLIIVGIVLILLSVFDYKHVGYIPFVVAIFLYIIASANLLYNARLLTGTVLRVTEASSLLACGAVLVLYVIFYSRKNKRGE